MESAPHQSGKPRSRRRVRSRCTAPASVVQRRFIPAYHLLTDTDLAALEQHADWLLETIGVDFREDPIALELFASAGAKVEGDRIKFEPGLIRSLCSTTPSEFQLHSRDPNHNVTIGGDHIVLIPGYGSPFVTDLDKGRRYATLDDFEKLVKLTYLSPALHHSGGTVCEPTDIPVNKRHLDMVAAHLRLSTKPFMGSVTSPQRARDSIEMAQLVYGAEFMQQHAVMHLTSREMSRIAPGQAAYLSVLTNNGTMVERLLAWIQSRLVWLTAPVILTDWVNHWHSLTFILRPQNLVQSLK